MLKNYRAPVSTLFLTIFLGSFSLSFSSANGQNSSQNNPYNSNRPQQWQQPSNGQSSTRQSTEQQGMNQQPVAYEDARDIDIHDRANRNGNWDYKENWRYNREAFYRGETQPEAYDEEHPQGTKIPGIDPDPEAIQMRNYYQEQKQRTNQNN